MYAFRSLETSNMELLLIIYNGSNLSAIVTKSQNFGFIRVLDRALKLIIKKITIFLCKCLTAGSNRKAE